MPNILLPNSAWGPFVPNSSSPGNFLLLEICFTKLPSDESSAPQTPMPRPCPACPCHPASPVPTALAMPSPCPASPCRRHPDPHPSSSPARAATPGRTHARGDFIALIINHAYYTVKLATRVPLHADGSAHVALHGFPALSTAQMVSHADLMSVHTS